MRSVPDLIRFKGLRPEYKVKLGSCWLSLANSTVASSHEEGREKRGTMCACMDDHRAQCSRSAHRSPAKGEGEGKRMTKSRRGMFVTGACPRWPARSQVWSSSATWPPPAPVQGEPWTAGEPPSECLCLAGQYLQGKGRGRGREGRVCCKSPSNDDDGSQ